MILITHAATLPRLQLNRAVQAQSDQLRTTTTQRRRRRCRQTSVNSLTAGPGHPGGSVRASVSVCVWRNRVLACAHASKKNPGMDCAQHTVAAG